jgi:hypothetical protein
MEECCSDAGGSSVAGNKETEVNTVVVPPVAPWTDDGPDGLVCELCSTSPSAASPYPSDHHKYLKYSGKWPWRRYAKEKFRTEWLVDDLDSAASSAARAHLVGTWVRVPGRRLCMVCFQLYAILGQLRDKIIEVWGCGWCAGCGGTGYCPTRLFSIAGRGIGGCPVIWPWARAHGPWPRRQL